MCIFLQSIYYCQAGDKFTGVSAGLFPTHVSLTRRRKPLSSLLSLQHREQCLTEQLPVAGLAVR